MTIARAPGSIEQALDKIAGEQLLGGWAGMAGVVDRAENTVRNWANPNTPESIPLDLALKLDLAWQMAGLIGAPIRDAYNALADQLREAEFGCQFELLRGAAAFAKENGEAEEALMLLALPGADEAAIAKAEREVSQVVALADNLRGMIRRLRRSPNRSPP
ncbi:hypothetical protein [Sphingomonas sp. IC4-52]|uniref:hypothetical protein n=1 Tax=Sphingomonas sp. IC4-52 TaxID=2887202 RepID=UPI001D11BE0F|nr:hypothetical protein [Sphingomonas sp. IC4-52]MCC2978884.1 hypothetical protein [Sphingomonas sp. IC4-52]